MRKIEILTILLVLSLFVLSIFLFSSFHSYKDIRTGPSTTITTYRDGSQSIAGSKVGGNAYIQSLIDKANSGGNKE